MTCSDPSLPTDERNLCVQAAHLFRDEAGLELSGHLHLQKEIPHGAGLGGGSSDAAATLRLLAAAWTADLPAGVMEEIAANLGSDVPFFLYDEPMLATSRGELLATLASPAYRLPYPLAVVMPVVRVVTAEAYELVQPFDERRPDLREVVLSNDLDRWRCELFNDFEALIMARHPEIREAKAALERSGAGYMALAGSGAAVFGVFEHEAGASAAAQEAAEMGLSSWWGYAAP